MTDLATIVTPEPGFHVGDPLGNLQRVTEVQFTPHPDGSSSELVFDTGGNYFQAWYGPEMQYRPREHPLELTWPEPPWGNNLAVFVPFTKLYKPTMESVPLLSTAWCPINPDREWDYYDFLVAFFEQIVERDEPAVCLEHDVVYRTDVEAGFLDCQLPWCHHLYSGRYEPRNADELQLAWVLLWTGCQRFRPEIAGNALDILRHIGGPRRTWRQVGDVLSIELAAQGWERHTHEPPVEHPLRSDGT